MPYVRIYSPELTLEKKREIVKDLTPVVIRALGLEDEARNWTTIHFKPYRLEDMAIGGILLSDTNDPEYQIIVHERNLTEDKKKILAKEITSTLARLLKIGAEKTFKINITIREYDSEDFAVGGKLISELEAGKKKKKN